MEYSKARKTSLYIAIILTLLSYSVVSGQGTIFGIVSNSDMTFPATGQVNIIGYLDDTDEEIKIEGCVGTDYDSVMWYDNFENYLTEAKGNPYDYHFFNIYNGESTILSKSIPDNSYQQENVQLTSATWPSPPSNITAVKQADSTVKISWAITAGVSYRIYRRSASSSGSFFRIDDPGGSLENPGVYDSIYIDYSVEYNNNYEYLIIAVESGTLGPHSDIIPITSGSFLCGDVNASGSVNLKDITYLIKFKYKGGPEPMPFESGDVNSDSSINIKDITYLIRYKYKGGDEPICL
jgi:hypothetical protein